MTSNRLNIRQCRKLLGLTQLDFGKRLGVSQTQIAKWENGRAKPQTGNKRKVQELVNNVSPTTKIDFDSWL